VEIASPNSASGANNYTSYWKHRG